MATAHKTILLNTMLCACRDEDPLIRTSALSNLAEICLVLHYKIGSIIYEVGMLCQKYTAYDFLNLIMFYTTIYVLAFISSSEIPPSQNIFTDIVSSGLIDPLCKI